mgnify:CR=1|tara:strand:- start:10 stop:648 length:639 start_codon:yes stop_codon:yes gene_type:complete
MTSDYSKSKIYKIVCNITGETYYGSTVQPIKLRMNNHKHSTNGRWPKAHQIIERGDYLYEVIEECPCENIEQLKYKERFWIENNDCVNINRPIITKEEHAKLKADWYIKNKEHCNNKNKEYREENKEKISEYNKIRRSDPVYKQTAKEANKKWRDDNKERVAENKRKWNEENQDKIKLQRKAYREANQEKIKERKRLAYLRKKEKEANIVLP